MRRKPRLFGNDGEIAVDDRKFFPPHDAENVFQELDARDIFIARVAVRKMETDVALAERSENRVDQRVEQHIGVGMAGEPRAVRNLDAAENELTPALKAMRVEAVTDA